MNPKMFLTWGGWVLVLVAILGAIGVIGPTADQSLFGESWYFDAAENWAHLIIGLVGLAAAMWTDAGMQRTLTWIVGIVALIIGLWGWFLSGDAPNFYGANLENPLDNILHLVVGIWALWAVMGKEE
ncbi:DUF4383 domain-containing protein [Candidatus Berkelbacteria bacterium]|nr:DUF4383 domain-containing protein [Candidatus Berkelbacteria bacterium]